jgi:hypothetical protein
MYICIYVYMYICIYVYIYICVVMRLRHGLVQRAHRLHWAYLFCVCTLTLIHVCLYIIQIYTCMNMCIHKCIYMYTFIRVHIYICIYVYMRCRATATLTGPVDRIELKAIWYVYVYTYIHKCISIHAYIHTYKFVRANFDYFCVWAHRACMFVRVWIFCVRAHRIAKAVFPRVSPVSERIERVLACVCRCTYAYVCACAHARVCVCVCVCVCMCVYLSSPCVHVCACVNVWICVRAPYCQGGRHASESSQWANRECVSVCV